LKLEGKLNSGGCYCLPKGVVGSAGNVNVDVNNMKLLMLAVAIIL
jgi:hypothetical protein